MHDATVAGFVPSKLNSERLPRKNVAELGGTPLVNWVLRTLDKASSVPDCVVFASDAEVMDFVDAQLTCRYVARPTRLDSDGAKVQDFVGAFLDAVECDVVVLLHITSPFIEVSTVETCVEAVVSGDFDSAFAVQEMRRFAWFGGAPLNYSLEQATPRTQDLEPVLVEQSGFYVFTRELFERSGRRIGERPYLHAVDAIEGHDIDTPEDLELARLLVDHVRVRAARS